MEWISWLGKLSTKLSRIAVNDPYITLTEIHLDKVRSRLFHARNWRLPVVQAKLWLERFADPYNTGSTVNLVFRNRFCQFLPSVSLGMVNQNGSSGSTQKSSRRQPPPTYSDTRPQATSPRTSGRPSARGPARYPAVMPTSILRGEETNLIHFTGGTRR